MLKGEETQQPGIDRNRIRQGIWSPGVDALGDDHISHESDGVENGNEGDGVGNGSIEKRYESTHESDSMASSPW